MDLSTKKGGPNSGGLTRGRGLRADDPIRRLYCCGRGLGWDGPEEEPEEGEASSKSDFQLPPG